MPTNGMPTPDLATATANLERSLQEFGQAFRASDLPRLAGGPLFQALRQWRSEQARTKQLPPYVIANDAVLRAIEEAKPADLASLKAIRGMGGSKVEVYGADILAIVAKAEAPA
jgi:ATP-dependent DNA helicase RecQ